MLTRISDLLAEFRRALLEYRENAKAYQDLESRLLELINSAIADGVIAIKTPSDVRNLVDAVTKLMESRAKLTQSLLSASAALKDIMAAQAAAEAVISASAAPTQIAAVKVAMLAEENPSEVAERDTDEATK